MPVKPKKIPMRMCVGCREMKEKRELLRVVHTPEGAVLLDRTCKLNGRGAYVCKSAQCLQKAVKTRQLERALSCPISQEVFESLQKAMAEDG